MISKYAGVCAACNQQYEVGAPIWYLKGHSTVCMDCHEQGAKNPPYPAKDGQAAPPPSSGPTASMRPAGGGGGSTAALEELRAIRALLAQILDVLTYPNRPQEPAAPPPVSEPTPF